MTQQEAPAGSRPRGPYGKTAARREAILDAALDVFAEQGYRAGSLREVAARVGLSEAGVLHHVASKEALLTAVLERRDALTGPLVPQGSDGARTLAALVALARRNAEAPGVVELFTVLAGEAVVPEHPAHAYFAARLARVRATLQAAFTDLHGRGRLAPGVTVASAVTSTIALWNGLQQEWLMLGGGAALDVPGELAAHLDRLTDPPVLTRPEGPPR